jgi:hypothetical protein
MAVYRWCEYRRLLQRKELDMDFLLYWTTWEQIIFVLVVFSLLSVLGLYLVRILVPLERLKQNHEVAGFTFGVIGAFYGLLLAFVIVAAWERFDRAQAEVHHEAFALVSLYRLSKGFTQPVSAEMQGAIRTYTRKLIYQDWPDMANYRYESFEQSMGPLVLWQIVTNYNPKDDSRQAMLIDKSFDQLNQLSTAFALRYLYSRENLPSVVWVVIYAGLLITIGFSYFFGLETFRSQALMCASFASLLGLTIVAILELAHPYQGAVTVSDRPLKYALMRMDDMDKVALTGLDKLRFAVALPNQSSQAAAHSRTTFTRLLVVPNTGKPRVTQAILGRPFEELDARLARTSHQVHDATTARC